MSDLRIFALLLTLVTSALAQQPPQRIAYVMSGHQGTIIPTRELYVSTLENKERKLIAELAWFPAWSPDGNQLAFFGSTSLPRDLTSGLNLLLYDVAKKKTTTLIDLRNDAAPQRPAWSPDGTRIAFAIVQNEGSFPAPYALPGKERRAKLMLIDVATRKAQQIQLSGGITCASDPSWAPDGKSLVVYECTSDKNGLALIDVTGKLVKRLTEPAAGTYDRFPAWSPDGKQIAFLSSRGDTAKIDSEVPRHLSIFAVNADGTNLRPLVTHDDLGIALPNWSSDGKLLACVAMQSPPLHGHFAKGALGTKVIVMTVGDWKVRAMLDEGTSDPALAPIPK